MPSLSDLAVRAQFVRTCTQNFDSLQSSSDSEVQGSLVLAVNAALRTAGVPEVSHNQEAGLGASGLFRFDHWRITFGRAQDDTPKTTSRVLDFVNTVYHEARHCEQWYRILQALAGGHIRLGMEDRMGSFKNFDPGSAKSMEDHLFVPRFVATRAIQNSNYAPVPKNTIERWWDSIYSRFGGLRGNVLNEIRRRHKSYMNLPEEQDAFLQGNTTERDLREAVGENRCAWPNLADWLELTGRAGHFRSGRFFGGGDSLVTLDTAIENYEQHHGAASIQEIRTAFDAWRRANPKEFAKRNLKKDVDGQGGIDKLIEFLGAGVHHGGVRVMV
jgi:hypothetical protein